MKAVRFDDYGGVEVLEVRDVARPEPGPIRFLWRSAPLASIPAKERFVRARSAKFSPPPFQAEGSDFAGVVEEIGPSVTIVALVTK